MESIERSDWAAVVTAFRAFFQDLGTVVADGDSVSFAAPDAGTGLVLGRDGTSSSFMPLHGLNAQWDEVTFDHEELAVTVTGRGFSYTYRVPPALRGP